VRPRRANRANLQGEVDGAALYRALADAEADPRSNRFTGRLAAVEEAHAEFLAQAAGSHRRARRAAGA